MNIVQFNNHHGMAFAIGAELVQQQQLRKLGPPPIE
jgi:hypothetical protein